MRSKSLAGRMEIFCGGDGEDKSGWDKSSASVPSTGQKKLLPLKSTSPRKYFQSSFWLSEVETTLIFQGFSNCFL